MVFERKWVVPGLERLARTDRNIWTQTSYPHRRPCCSAPLLAPYCGGIIVLTSIPTIPPLSMRPFALGARDICGERDVWLVGENLTCSIPTLYERLYNQQKGL